LIKQFFYNKIYFLKNKHLSVNKLQYFTFFIFLLIPLIFVFHKFIFGKNIFLYKDIGSDSINIFYPTLLHYADYIKQWGIPSWSFSQGMGQWIFPFCFSDIFNIPIYFLKREIIAYSIAYSEMFKLFLGGTFFFLFLKTASFPYYVCTIGGILYSFLGFTIIGTCWNIFSTEAVLFSFLLLSLELFFRKKIWFFIPISFALISSFQPFLVYIYGLFSFIFLLFRLIDIKSSFKKILVVQLKYFAFVLLGIGISSVLLIPEVLQLLQSPRANKASYFSLLINNPIFKIIDPLEATTLAYRFFSNDLIGTGSFFSGWYNYLEAPAFYCGIITLIIAPQAFPFMNKRKKILTAIVIFGMIFILIFPFFRYAFWLFTGNYYRSLSLIISSCILILGCFSLSQILRFHNNSLIVLLLTFFLLIFLLYNPFLTKFVNINKELRFFCSLLLFCYTFLFACYKLFVNKNVFIFLIFTLTIFEVSCLSYITINRRSVVSKQELSKRIGYNDYTLEAIAFLKNIDKGFFRINKLFSSGLSFQNSINDAKAQGYYGTSSYYSFNQKYFLKFLDEFKVIDGTNEVHTRWILGLIYRPLLEAISTVKYVLAKDTSYFKDNPFYNLVAKVNDIFIYKNNFALPLGFAYDSVITLSDFRKLNKTQKEYFILRAGVIDESEKPFFNFPNITIHDSITPSNFLFLIENFVKKRKQDTLSIIYHSPNKIVGNIFLTSKKIMFFSIPFDKGWKVFVDGKKAKIYLINIGFFGFPVEKGKHIIELKYFNYTLPFSFILSIIFIISYIIILFYYKKNKSNRLYA
jgi:uncharacterized membrane protein YfhO